MSTRDNRYKKRAGQGKSKEFEERNRTKKGKVGVRKIGREKREIKERKGTKITREK